MPPEPKPEPWPVLPAAAVPPEPDGSGWLVEGLWGRQAVGLIGGAPKCGKTWLALDLAVSVASGTPALGHFSVLDPGPVLFYGAEDAPAQLRTRLSAIATARGLGLSDLDLGLILAPSLRLDTEGDQARLFATLDTHRPRLLILDPLVRLHRIDENKASDIAALLAELRLCQREYGLALILVHHLRKQAGPVDGQALRGSGDLHAWGDSNLFLRRRHQQLLLTAEHRMAPSPPPISLELTLEPTPHLGLVAADPEDATPTAELAQRLLDTLGTAGHPLSREALRQTLRIRNAGLGETLARLRAEGRIERTEAGFALVQAVDQPAVPVPTPTQRGNGNRERPPAAVQKSAESDDR